MHCKIIYSGFHLLFMNVTPFLYKINTEVYLFIASNLIAFAANTCTWGVFVATRGHQVFSGDSDLLTGLRSEKK